MQHIIANAIMGENRQMWKMPIDMPQLWACNSYEQAMVGPIPMWLTSDNYSWSTYSHFNPPLPDFQPGVYQKILDQIPKDLHPAASRIDDVDINILWHRQGTETIIACECRIDDYPRLFRYYWDKISIRHCVTMPIYAKCIELSGIYCNRTDRIHDVDHYFADEIIVWVPSRLRTAVPKTLTVRGGGGNFDSRIYLEGPFDVTMHRGDKQISIDISQISGATGLKIVARRAQIIMIIGVIGVKLVIQAPVNVAITSSGAYELVPI